MRKLLTAFALFFSAYAYAQPANNECATAVTLVPGATNTAGTVRNATASASIPVGCATGTPDDDVWYKFTAAYSYATISLSNIGTNLATSGARLQLFSGACGSLVSFACGNIQINATGLTAGNVYYIRVYSAGTGQAGFTAAGSAFYISVTPSAPVVVGSGRMSEVFQQTIISAPSVLADPWEITYGPDNNLWITESKGYKVYRMNPVTGVRDTVLNIAQGSTFFSAPADVAFNAQFNIAVNNPQGGLAGLALHPKFLDPVTPQNYVYISYVHTFISDNTPNGVFYTNRLVRFTYNTTTGKFESPVSLCDTLPGSGDHNSQRMIIAPVGGTNYLFYAQGDMGAGQFGNKGRTMKAQLMNSYEGKILRFNLTPDGDAGTLDKWIPNDNPFNVTLGVQSAVWATGIRNNQGFAYDAVRDILYGTSHGPYTDDELNIIQQGKNYGHPIVIGFAADNNYNNSSAGGNNSALPVSTCPVITSETTNATNIGSSYKDPLFSAYAVPQATVSNLYTTNPNNATWPSEGWSGLDLYSNTVVPGWKGSLIACSLKWGRLLRLKLGPAGTTIIPTNGTDTVSYFGSTNRFRDMAISPNGKDMYVIMDRSATTSGPSAANPVVPACGGCVQKYTFLGYLDAAGKSSIPTAIDVTDGTVNTCNSGTTITIDNTNNNLWVPITGPDGNIMAEIHANGNNLGTVTSSFYKNSGSIRSINGVHYLDRNITITPQNQPSSAVHIRLYISKAEYDALDADPLSGISAIGNVKILKNSDPCGSAVLSNTTLITPTFSGAHGANGYVIQGDIASFSSFYFASSNIVLPVQLLSFKGSVQDNNTVLNWKTENEVNTSRFLIERSEDGTNFTAIGNVPSIRTSGSQVLDYAYTDANSASRQLPVLYYRLRIVDLDGAYKYSNVVAVTFANPNGIITLSPNPVAQETTVSILAPQDGSVKWVLVDNAGRVVMRNSLTVRKGNVATLKLNMSQLSAGMYYLKVNGADIDANIKVQKQ